MSYFMGLYPPKNETINQTKNDMFEKAPFAMGADDDLNIVSGW
jgi:hypothetical protein